MDNKYSLLGSLELKATDSINWFRPRVDPQDIRKLMKKSNKLALKDTFIWFGGLFISAYIAIVLSPSLI